MYVINMLHYEMDASRVAAKVEAPPKELLATALSKTVTVPHWYKVTPATLTSTININIHLVVTSIQIQTKISAFCSTGNIKRIARIDRRFLCIPNHGTIDKSKVIRLHGLRAIAMHIAIHLRIFLRTLPSSDIPPWSIHRKVKVENFSFLAATTRH
jgi:hypothetical protein